MKGDTVASLIAANEPPPVRVINPGGTASFLLIGDHAGNAVPASLGSLGVPDDEMRRHIGWDIGIGGMGALLADALDAVFVRQTYSRLVIDCNRDPAATDAMPEISDGTRIPANEGLAPSARAARVAVIHTPYQQAIAAEIARRDAAGQDTILIALHSFTPAMRGVARPWQIGVLYDAGDPAFARAFLEVLRGQHDLTVGDNEPYRMDLIDYTIPRHAYPGRRPYVEIEIRQDLMATPEGEAAWARRLATLLPEAARAIGRG